MFAHTHTHIQTCTHTYMYTVTLTHGYIHIHIHTHTPQAQNLLRMWFRQQATPQDSRGLEIPGSQCTLPRSSHGLVGSHPSSQGKDLGFSEALQPQDFATRLRTRRQKSVQNKGHRPSVAHLWDRGPCTPSHASPTANCLVGLCWTWLPESSPCVVCAKAGRFLKGRHRCSSGVGWSQSHHQELQAYVNTISGS